jgi:glycosyltransferase involved in cell wall biosynthesis
MSDPTWTFVAPGLPRPAGGLIALYELANALARAGSAVQIAHLPTSETTLRSTSQIPWFAFDTTVEHLFLARLDPDLLPTADLVLYTVMAVELGTAPDAGESGHRLVAALQAETSPAGLPILFVQALGIFPAATELLSLRGAGPKVCVASWIAKNLIAAGLPADEVVHVPDGLDHSTFRVLLPVNGRSPAVAMNANPHPLKNTSSGLAALARLDRELSLPSTVFGTVAPATLSEKMRFLPSPSQSELASDVYNAATLFLQPSSQEGFGLCAIEAMACGCALVTPSNGGSDDYALDGETAVVCGTDPDSMADALAALHHDERRRVRIATEGARYVDRFRWPLGAERLRALGADYVARPDAYRRGQRVEVGPEALVLHR